MDRSRRLIVVGLMMALTAVGGGVTGAEAQSGSIDRPPERAGVSPDAPAHAAAPIQGNTDRSSRPPLRCDRAPIPSSARPGVGRGDRGRAQQRSCCVAASDREHDTPSNGTGRLRWPACTRSADEHRGAAWDAAARVGESRALLADLEANPPPSTAEPTDPDAQTCPTVTKVSSAYFPDGFNQLVLANVINTRSWWLLQVDGSWDESACPTFTVPPLESLEFEGSPYAALGPDTAARVSIFKNGADRVAYFAPDYSSNVPFILADTATGGAIATTAQFFLDEAWCSRCQFNGTVYNDVDLSDGSGVPGGVRVATAADATFNWVQLTNVNLDAADLSGSSFQTSPGRPTSLRQVSLRGANLSNVVFDAGEAQTVLTGVDFTGANLACAQFRGVVLGPDVTFEGANWGTNCANPHFDDVVMEIETLASIASPDARIEASSIHVGSPESSAALKAPDGGVTDLRWMRFTNSNFFGYPLDLGAEIGSGESVSAEVVLAGAVLDGSRFSGANLQGADLAGASLQNALFSGADLWLANLSDATAPSAGFQGSRVWNATFTGANLTAADFAGADAHGAQFGSVSAARADFANAYLFPGGSQGATPVSFSGADLSNANFAGALIGEANFEGAATRLVGAKFTGAQCISCNFSNATMVASGQGVDFQRSYLHGTTFATSLAMADFTDASCCATIPPGQESLAWEFSMYVPVGQGIAGPNVLFGDAGLAAAYVQGAICPDGSRAGASGCTVSQLTVTNPGRLGCTSAYVYTCPPTITTRAGTGTRGYDPTNEFALSSPLGDPSSVVVTDAGLMFADPSNHVVRLVTNVNSPDPIITELVGTGVAGSGGDGGPADQAQLASPTGLAIRESDGALAIADRDANVVRLVGTDGVISTIAGDGSECTEPAGACGDGGSAVEAQLSGPTTVWFAPNDDLYIADTGNHKIRIVDGDTGFMATIAGDGTACATSAAPACGDGGAATAAQLASPTGGLIGDAHGNVYVADTGTGRLRLIDPNQNLQSVTPQGALQAPTGVAIDAVGNRYVADRGSHAIYRISAVGIPIPRLWAGTPGTPCTNPTATTNPCGDNGFAAVAAFNEPTGMFITPGAPLSLYVTDTADQRVRHISAPF